MTLIFVMNSLTVEIYGIELPEDIENLILDYKSQMENKMKLIKKVPIWEDEIKTFLRFTYEIKIMLKFDLLNEERVMLRRALKSFTSKTRYRKKKIKEMKEYWIYDTNILKLPFFHGNKTKLQRQFNRTKNQAHVVRKYLNVSRDHKIFITDMETITKLKWMEKYYKSLLITSTFNRLKFTSKKFSDGALISR